MKLLDANVFVYSAGRDPLHREPCRQVLAAVASGRIEATTDIEVFQELLHHYHSLRMTDRAVQAVREALGAFPNAIEITPRIIERALDALSRYPHLQSRDAVHAAVVLENRLEGIISADRVFDGIAGLTRFDPRDL